MSRLQLALDVDDLDQAVDFYSTLFDTTPVKRRPGYANFAVADPPLKLVLFENPGAGRGINHLGIEVDTPEVVAVEQQRLAAAGLATETEKDTACCYARQDKFWLEDTPHGLWEVYAVLGDDRADLEGVSDLELSAVEGNGECCGSTSEHQAVSCC